MLLSDILRHECIDIAPDLRDKAAVLQRIVEIAKKSAILENVSPDEILQGLQERESLGSTAFGKGIAIPHCRLESVTNFVVGIITAPSGVDFKAPDGEKTKVFIFIVAPARQSDNHLRLLSVISQTLLVRRVMKEILAEQTPEGVRERFLGNIRTRLDTKTRTGKSLVHVFVQDESVFREIAQVLAGLDPSSVIVANADHLGNYLAKIPLFAVLLRDEKRQATKVALLVVDSKLTNETLRAIESVAGDLDDTTGVMVTVQELAHVAGSLNEPL